MNRLSDETGASSPNDVPGIILARKNSSKTIDSKDGSVFISTSFRNIIVKASEKASLAADEQHMENKINTERHHKETQVAEDKCHKEIQVAQDKQVVLKNNLVNNSRAKSQLGSL
jgi:hypothetical protein